MTFQLLLAVLAGFSFSLIAVAYRSNSARGIPPAFAAVGMGLAGVLWFGYRSFAGADAPGPGAPAMVWVWGAVNGLAQGFAVYLYRVGLRHGPLGPVWCAGNLTFVTPALYAVLLLSESLSGLQTAGMLCAFLCVAVSSMGHGEEPGPNGAARATAAQRLVYGGVLLALVFLTGLVGVGLKHMTATIRDGAPLNPRYNDCFMLGMYAVLTVCVLAEAVKHGGPRVSRFRLALTGLTAGVGSVGGMVLTSKVSGLPGGVGFAVISVSAVMAGALITSFGFHEKRGRAWYATLVFAVASVILFNLAR
jgi:drug/metabolite transporter (DMT)-like permease